MPRIIVTLLDKPNGEHEESCPTDYCRTCYNAVKDDEFLHIERAGYWGGTFENRVEIDLNCEHPPYDDDPDYTCEECGKNLTDKRDCYEVGTAYYSGDKEVIMR